MMKKTRFSRAAAILLLSVGNGGMALGHADPFGDIHPLVTAVDGKFMIAFQTHLPDQSSDDSESPALRRVIYNLDGTLFAPRHSLRKKQNWMETGPGGIMGTKIPFGDSTIYFREVGGKPGYLLESADGQKRSVRLPWPEKISIYRFEDVEVTAEGVAITGKEDAKTLKFYWFPHGKTAPPTVLTLGETACIYDFPVASNMAFSAGRFWVAFMRPRDEQGLDLVMWSWKPEDKEARFEVLNQPTHWNSHMSLAAIEDRLCLAYHCVISPEDAPIAKIITVFRKAE